MGTANGQMTTPAAGGSFCHGAGQASPGWFSRRRSFVVGVAAAAAAIALTLSQHWLAIADLVPLLAVLPWAVMMFPLHEGHESRTADRHSSSLASERSAYPTHIRRESDRPGQLGR